MLFLIQNCFILNLKQAGIPTSSDYMCHRYILCLVLGEEWGLGEGSMDRVLEESEGGAFKPALVGWERLV